MVGFTSCWPVLSDRMGDSVDRLNHQVVRRISQGRLGQFGNIGIISR